MRKILYSFVAILMSAALLAQQSPVTSPYGEMPAKMTEFNFTNSGKANQSSDWYNYMRELMNIVTNMPYFRNYLFPDSTVRTEFATGIGYVWTHSLGQVLDPTSSYYLTDAPKISKDAKYTLDSIAVPYRYHRPQPQPTPDTLIIQFFSHDELTFVPNPSWTTPKSYATTDYNYVARKGANPVKEIVVLLDDQDTITSAQGLIVEEVGLAVDPGEKIAVAFTYIPGNPFNVDDTIDFYLVPPAANPINAFVIYTGRDETPTIDNNYYNHGMMVTSDVRYNVNTNGWNGNYIPGVAFFSGNYHTDVFFRLTYDDFTDIKKENSGEFARFSPNPASSNLRMEYQINEAGIAEIEIVNLLGNVVYRSNLDVKGNTHLIDVTKLSEGVYFTRFVIDGNVLGTSKIVVRR